MTTATDHENNLNRSTLKKNHARTLRVETIANSAGGTAAVAFLWTAPIGFRLVTTLWGLPADQRGIEPPPVAQGRLGTAAVAMVAQPSTGFLNGRFNPDGSLREDTEDCVGRITVGLTRSKSLTLVVFPLDMMGLIVATIAYGTQDLRRGVTTWDWPSFNANPEQENNSQNRKMVPA